MSARCTLFSLRYRAQRIEIRHFCTAVTIQNVGERNCFEMTAEYDYCGIVIRLLYRTQDNARGLLVAENHFRHSQL